MADDDDSEGLSISWQRALAVAKIIALIATPVIIAIGTNQINLSIKQQDVKVRMLEIAIDILKTDPQKLSNDPQLRDWAINLLEKNSDVPTPKEARDALKQKPLLIPNPPAGLKIQ